MKADRVMIQVAFDTSDAKAIEFLAKRDRISRAELYRRAVAAFVHARRFEIPPPNADPRQVGLFEAGGRTLTGGDPEP